jgi:hypothetical protein
MALRMITVSFPLLHMYDAHLFLNSLYTEGVLKGVSSNVSFPKSTWGDESAYVKNFRLRYDVDHG